MTKFGNKMNKMLFFPFFSIMQSPSILASAQFCRVLSLNLLFACLQLTIFWTMILFSSEKIILHSKEKEIKK